VTFEEMEQALRKRLEALPPAARAELLHVLMWPQATLADTSSVKFEGDIAAFEAACLKEIRESLERCEGADYDCSPFRNLVGVELEGTYPDTAVVVTYCCKPRYDPKQEELRANFPIWSEPGEYSDFKPLAPSSDEMWSEAGEQEAYLWFIEPDERTVGR
jgi:hypothetical protein